MFLRQFGDASPARSFFLAGSSKFANESNDAYIVAVDDASITATSVFKRTVSVKRAKFSAKWSGSATALDSTRIWSMFGDLESIVI